MYIYIIRDWFKTWTHSSWISWSLSSFYYIVRLVNIYIYMYICTLIHLYICWYVAHLYNLYNRVKESFSRKKNSFSNLGFTYIHSNAYLYINYIDIWTILYILDTTVLFNKRGSFSNALFLLQNDMFLKSQFLIK